MQSFFMQTTKTLIRMQADLLVYLFLKNFIHLFCGLDWGRGVGGEWLGGGGWEVVVVNCHQI